MNLTTSEARAEACTLVLRILLSRMPQKDLDRVHAAASIEAYTIGHPDITEEVGWIFHNLKT